MSQIKGRWILGGMLLGLVTAGTALGSEPVQESAPTEGEVGTRATPMLREQIPFAVPTLPRSGSAPPPAASPSCLKQIYDSAYVTQQPIPPAQYYSVASSAFIRTRSNRADVNEFGLTAQELVGTASQPEDIAFAPVHLPHGATIRELVVVLYDSSGKDNLQVTLSRRMGDQPRASAKILTLESDCVLVSNVSSMRVPNLVIPYDGKYAHVLKFAVVPSQTPVASLPNPIVSVFEVRIGYTMP